MQNQNLNLKKQPSQNRQPEGDIAYNFYATLLDGYTDYLDSDEIYSKYWGNSENPPFTCEEYQQQQFQSLIDKINRVPFDSEAADKGTCFNEIVDCIIDHRQSDKMDIRKVYETIVKGQVDNCDPDERWADVEITDKVIGIEATYKDRTFFFDVNLCREFANYYKGALTQQFVSAILPTMYGNVKLYGYVDELMPQSIHDIKTTKSYNVGNYKKHWQHHVYPYCYDQNGIFIPIFEYNIAQIEKNGRWQTFTETYNYRPEVTRELLIEHCENLIRFLEDNKELITDTKIAPIWQKNKEVGAPTP